METIPLFRPYMPVDLPELDTILHSGKLAYGNWGKRFEQKLGEYIGETRITSMNSYNSAMLVALSVIGAKNGDEIIASPMSCLASNQPFATQNLKVVWADIDPMTGTLCPDSVKSKISSKTKAIFHNHYCGFLGYIDEINQIGKEKGIVVVDDAIEAFGSEYRNKRIGNVGTDMTIFSFQTVRLPNTIEGGAIAFNNGDFYKKALLIRDYGIDRTKFRDEFGEINPACDITLPGFGATLNDINSYLGVIQMEKVEELIQIQRKNAQKWENVIKNKFANCEFINTSSIIKPNFWVFGLLSPFKNKLIKHFRSENYYASSVHLPNNYYSVFGNSKTLFGVNEFYSKFLALPCGWWVTV